MVIKMRLVKEVDDGYEITKRSKPFIIKIMIDYWGEIEKVDSYHK